MYKQQSNPIQYPSELVDFCLRDNNTDYTIKIPKFEEFRIQEIFVNKAYSVPCMSSLKNAKIVDIGANIGLFTLFVKLICPDASVHCYEPAPNTLPLLTINVASLANVHIHPCGVSNHRGESLIHLCRTNTGENSIKKTKHTDQLGEHTIKLIEAESIFENKENIIDILKIDTEGCEVEIIESLQSNKLLSRINFILLEYHSESDRKIIDALLEDFSIFGASIGSIHRGLMKYIRNDLIGTDLSAGIIINNEI